MGREREVAELLGGLEDASAGEGRLFLISGEPGIGKSRLVDELANLARKREARVLWGRCWEAGGAPAYWPWVQSLRTYIRDEDPGRLVAQMGSGARFIAQMMPEVRDIIGELPAAPPLETEAARFRLFDATATFLANASVGQPLVVLFDDLQAADEPSLLLLQFVARQLSEARILMVCTYRDVEVATDEALASSLTELDRAPAARRIDLEGLEEGDVGRFIEVTTGTPATGTVVATIHDRTEGNPLFVGELARLLASEGGLGPSDLPMGRSAIPAGVREVIGRRLGQLSTECAEVLAVASVMGRQFDIDVVRRATGRSVEDMLRVLEEAGRARIVQDGTGMTGQLRFSHVLLRDVIYDQLPAARRIELHRGVAEVLETLAQPDLEPHLASLALHFFEAAPGGDVEKAVDYARRAGDRAARLLAYEEAVRLYGMALRALDLGERGDDETRCELLIVLGDAQARAGDDAGSRDTLLKAAALGKGLDLPELLGRAALGYGGRFVWARGSVDPRVVPLLREALTALPEEDSALRARLLARLSGALRDEHDRSTRVSLSGEAVEMARRIGDPSTLAYALDGRYAAVYSPDNVDVQLALAAELLHAAEAAGDLERAADAHLYRFWGLFEMGDMAGVYRQLVELARAAAELRQPAQSWGELVTRAQLSLFEGRLDDAERFIGKAMKAGERGEYQSRVSFITQTFALRKEQGRLQEVRQALEEVAARYTGRPMFACLLASLHTELGDRTKAQRIFEGLGVGGFALARDPEFTLNMSLLSEVAAFLGDADRAATLYELLLPYEKLIVLDPNEFSMGAVPRYLGLLASATSQWEKASMHFESALERNERTGGRPWVAHTMHDYARMLASRGGPGDMERAVRLLGEALETCRDIGMTALEHRATGLLERLGAAPEGTATPEEQRLVAAVFRREGEYWTIRFQGDAFRLKDSKGLRYLAVLLAQPAREVHAIDLVVAWEGGAGPGRAIARDPEMGEPGDAGEILDPQARKAYRRRLEALQEELEEAESFGDAERAARARAEMEFVARELGAATGLGGRSRRAGSPLERARINATKAIKAALRRIGEHSPSLQRHLTRSVVTGTFCSYAPDPQAAPRWEI